MAVLLVASFVAVLNETIMTVALPRLMEELDVSANTGQWLTTSYMLTMAVVIPTTGYLIQRFTTRRLFFSALVIFVVGTVVAAAAPGFELLLIGRVTQAIGAAILLPLMMTTVLAIAPTGRRGTLMGVVTIVLAVAPAVGPAASGIILQFFTWRYLFLLLLPVALLALVLGAIWLRNVGRTTRRSLDVLSVALAIFAFGPLVYGLSSLGEAAHSDAAIIIGVVCAAIGLGFLALFGWRQVVLRRVGAPLLDIGVFASRTFRFSLTLLLLGMGTYLGTLLVLPLYLQRGLGVDVLTAGLVMLPGSLLMGLMGPISGRIFDSVGARPLTILASLILTGSYIGLAFVGDDTPVWWVAILFTVLVGFGMGLLATPTVTSALESLTPQLYSHGNATISSLQQVAGAAGSALLIAIVSVVSSSAAPGSEIHAEITGIRVGFGVAAAIALTMTVLSIVHRPRQGTDHADRAASDTASLAARG